MEICSDQDMLNCFMSIFALTFLQDYTWCIVSCSLCQAHIGWRYDFQGEHDQNDVHLHRFFGLCRASLNFGDFPLIRQQTQPHNAQESSSDGDEDEDGEEELDFDSEDSDNLDFDASQPFL